jgi:hypothetical protein
METIAQEEEFDFKAWMGSMTFPALILLAAILAWGAGGAVKSGMFMGFMSTLALWCVVIKLPIWVKKLMCRHVLISDLILSVILVGVFAPLIGSGPTVFMAAVTQAVLLSILLFGLKCQYEEVPCGI